MNGNQGLIFGCDHEPRKSMSENKANKALLVMTCSSLVKAGLWSSYTADEFGLQP